MLQINQCSLIHQIARVIWLFHQKCIVFCRLQCNNLVKVTSFKAAMEHYSQNFVASAFWIQDKFRRFFQSLISNVYFCGVEIIVTEWSTKQNKYQLLAHERNRHMISVGKGPPSFTSTPLIILLGLATPWEST